MCFNECRNFIIYELKLMPGAPIHITKQSHASLKLGNLCFRKKTFRVYLAIFLRDFFIFILFKITIF